LLLLGCATQVAAQNQPCTSWEDCNYASCRLREPSTAKVIDMKCQCETSYSGNDYPGGTIYARWCYEYNFLSKPVIPNNICFKTIYYNDTYRWFQPCPQYNMDVIYLATIDSNYEPCAKSQHCNYPGCAVSGYDWGCACIPRTYSYGVKATCPSKTFPAIKDHTCWKTDPASATQNPMRCPPNPARNTTILLSYSTSR